jgi:perosamine synthetase
MVIEDAACALGASHKGRFLGTWGQLGCFSFHPRKTLTTAEGGLVCTDDPVLAERLRALRSHGMVRSGGEVSFSEPGLNYRLTDLQSALGRHQLPSLDAWIARRRELASFYRAELADLERQGEIRLPQDLPGHSYQTFMLVLSPRYKRSAVIQGLAALEIEANLGAQSLSELGLYGTQASLSVGPELFHHGLAIPLHESLSNQDASRVVMALKQVLAGS